MRWRISLEVYRMTFWIVLLNLFFIPMITVYIRYARTGQAMKFSLSFLVKYAVITVLVFVGTKVVGMMAGAILPLVLTPDRAAYTVCAIVVAVVLPYIYEFFHKYLHFRVKVEKRQDEE